MAKGDKYSDMNEMACFGFLANALSDGTRGDGNTGSVFPRSDAEDFSRGARFVPGEVTLARRKGEKVNFNTDCQCTCCWYWEMSDGTRIYHFDPGEYEQLKSHGRCPHCGNTHINGGMVRP